MNNSMEIAKRILKQSNFVGPRAAKKIAFIEVHPKRILKEEITYMTPNGAQVKEIMYLGYIGKAYSKNPAGWIPIGEFYGKIPMEMIPKGALTPLLRGVELS